MQDVFLKDPIWTCSILSFACACRHIWRTANIVVEQHLAVHISPITRQAPRIVPQSQRELFLSSAGVWKMETCALAKAKLVNRFEKETWLLLAVRYRAATFSGFCSSNGRGKLHDSQAEESTDSGGEGKWFLKKWQTHAPRR